MVVMPAKSTTSGCQARNTSCLLARRTMLGRVVMPMPFVGALHAADEGLESAKLDALKAATAYIMALQGDGGATGSGLS